MRQSKQTPLSSSSEKPCLFDIMVQVAIIVILPQFPQVLSAVSDHGSLVGAGSGVVGGGRWFRRGFGLVRVRPHQCTPGRRHLLNIRASAAGQVACKG